MQYLYRFVGTSRLHQARQHIGLAVQAWSGQWRPDHTLHSLDVVVEAVSDSSPDSSEWHFPTGDSRLALAGSESAWLNLLFGTASPNIPDDNIRRSLLLAAQTSLLQFIGKTNPSPSVPIPENVQRHHAATWLIAKISLFCSESFAGVPIADEIHLRVDAGLFDSVLKSHSRTESSATPLLSRSQCIAPATLPISLTIPVARICIEELRQLRPGAVIRCQHALTDPLVVATDTNPHIASAYLGQTSGQRALRLCKFTAPSAT